MSTLFSVSIALLTGLLMPRVLKPLKMPDVTAYLLAGVLVGPFSLGLLGVEGLGFTSLDSVASLSLISEVALGFIAFSIGNEFRLSDLKHIGRQAVVIGIVQALLATLFVDLALLTLHLLFPALITPAQAITLVAGTIDLISILVNPFVAIVVSLLLGAATGWPLTKPEPLLHSNTNRLNMTIVFCSAPPARYWVPLSAPCGPGAPKLCADIWASRCCRRPVWHWACV